MNRRVLKNIVISIVVIIIFSMVGYTVYSVESYKARVRKMIEEQERIEKLEKELREKSLEALKRDKEEKALQIIEFHEKYLKVRNDFINNVQKISEKMDNNPTSIEDIKVLTKQRIDAVKDYRQRLENIEIPSTLNFFYEYEIGFINHDIETWNLTHAYYESKFYSTYNTDELNKLHKENVRLFSEAEKELKNVYGKYGLDSLIDDFIKLI